MVIDVLDIHGDGTRRGYVLRNMRRCRARAAPPLSEERKIRKPPRKRKGPAPEMGAGPFLLHEA